MTVSLLQIRSMLLKNSVDDILDTVITTEDGENVSLRNDLLNTGSGAIDRMVRALYLFISSIRSFRIPLISQVVDIVQLGAWKLSLFFAAIYQALVGIPLSSMINALKDAEFLNINLVPEDFKPKLASLARLVTIDGEGIFLMFVYVLAVMTASLLIVIGFVGIKGIPLIGDVASVIVSLIRRVLKVVS